MNGIVFISAYINAILRLSCMHGIYCDIDNQLLNEEANEQVSQQTEGLMILVTGGTPDIPRVRLIVKHTNGVIISFSKLLTHFHLASLLT